ncbi:MAG: UDP-N-acetylmuramoylalanyl-D-glutamyl-2,6-diaminopimelate--D-alanyl-D-alanine ligase [Rhodospirillaceae bacterium]|nr:UDP-N-acetylmuramoylalanyl-D-glutamyl-2,6-diaminopimelate--D-alanyl-D-alanine ligase [Rhodospirillaceae bacterium]
MAAPAPTPLWTSQEAAAATDGTVFGSWSASHVSIDSRAVAAGDLFVALCGPNHDGHDYVAKALKAGAAAAMVKRRPAGLAADAPLLEVPDTLAGLTALGRYARLRSAAQVIGVTGSVGKTGTKEMLAQALATQGPTFATIGNLNNHIGVPLTLARMPAATLYAVVEMGMNHAGEIRPLSRLAAPHVAVITTVTDAHLENFRDIGGIADAKAEIFEGMEPSGTAVLNREDSQFARLLAHARTAGIGRIWTFGRHQSCDARLLDASVHATCSAVHAAIRGEVISYSLSVPGQHWVMNSLAVLLAVRAVGGDITQAARMLSTLRAPAGRGARRKVVRADGTAFLVIDESYNASPAAVRAALSVLASSPVGKGGRRVLVLGDMLELGEDAPRLHADLAAAVDAAKVDRVHACGRLCRHLYDALPEAVRGTWAGDSGALTQAVLDDVAAGDVVLVKGSLGSRMKPIVEALYALDTSQAAGGGSSKAASCRSSFDAVRSARAANDG